MTDADITSESGMMECAQDDLVQDDGGEEGPRGRP